MSEELQEVVNQETPNEVTPKKVKKKSKVRSIIGWVLTGIFAAFFVVFAIGQITGMVNKKNNYGETLTYGYGTFVITSASMEPDYKTGTAIITHKDSAASITKRFDRGETVDITMYCAYISNNITYDYPYYRPGNIEYGGISYHLEGNDPVYPSSGSYVLTHRLIDYHIDESRALGKGRYTFVIAGINTEGDYAKEGQYQLLTENEILGIVKVNSQFLGGLFKFITSPWGLLVFLLVPAFYLVITSVLDIFKALKEPEEGETGKDKDKKESSGIDGLSKEDKERLKKEMLDEMLNKKKGDKK